MLLYLYVYRQKTKLTFFLNDGLQASNVKLFSIMRQGCKKDDVNSQVVSVDLMHIDTLLHNVTML